MAAIPSAILLMGPTAIGKSEVALYLAERFDCEIVSVDSALVYRGMDIGTAKPDRSIRTRIPHHLIDILDPAEYFSTGRFCAAARTLIAAIAARGKMPLLVGGTMLYFHALTSGLAELPPADPQIRAELAETAERHGWAALHQQLAGVDADAAARIHPNDPQRIQRALEVFRVTGRKLSELQRAPLVTALSFAPLKLALLPCERRDLHQRIAERFHTMLGHGLIDEVRALYARGDLHTALPSVRSVGYRQVWGYLNGDYDQGHMTDTAIYATRQLAKRQITWLRHTRLDANFITGAAPPVRDIEEAIEAFLQARARVAE